MPPSRPSAVILPRTLDHVAFSLQSSLLTAWYQLHYWFNMSSVRRPALLLASEPETLTAIEVVFSFFYRCPKFPVECPFTTDLEAEFLDHLKFAKSSQECHAGQDTFKCCYCSEYSTQNPSELASHYAESHGDLVYQCNLCLFRCSRIEHLISHHISCHPENLSLATMDEEIDKINDLVESRFILCSKKIQTVRHLDAMLISSNHCSKHHTPQDQRSVSHFLCTFCDSKFDNDSQLRFHQFLKHPNMPVASLHWKGVSEKKSVHFSPHK